MAIPLPDPVNELVSEALLRLQDLNAQRQPMPPLIAKWATTLFLSVAILTTLPPPGPTRVVVGLTALSTIWLYALTHWATGAYFFLDAIIIISITFRWLVIFLSGTPEVDSQQTSATATILSEKGPWYKRFLTKLKWTIELWSCWRGVGWNFEDKNMRKGSEQKQTKIEFVLINVCRVALNMFMSQMILKYAFCSFWPKNIVPEVGVEFNSLPPLHRHMLVACQLVRDYLMLDGEYRKIAIACVTLQLSTPDRWPPLFGNALDLYSVRNFWGRCWHQTFRNLFTKCSDMVAQAIGAQKGTLLHKYTKLYVGFLVSGVQHYAPPLFAISPRYGWGMFWQMPAYAAVITLEDFIKFCGTKIGIEDSVFVRSLGYVWTAYWMTLLYGLPVGYVSDIGGFAGICG